MIHTLVAVVVVLGVLIFFHELGHFLVARRLGIKVLRFSLGFGPKVVGFVRGETEYVLSAVPLGGYVKMLGENPGEPVPPEEVSRSFSHRPLGHQALVVAAGPVANFVLAWVLFALVFAFQGKPVYLPQVGKVLPDSPAAEAGLAPGDLILRVGDREVSTWEELNEIIRQSEGRPLRLLVKRGDQEVSLTVTPRLREAKNIFGETVRVPMIGVVSAGRARFERVTPLRALYEALVMVAAMVKLTLVSIVKLIERVLPLSTLGGPIFIAKLAGEQAQAGLWPFVSFMAVLSVNLGVLNLLPIPMLDGGHLAIYAVEATIRRPLSPRVKEYVQQVGLALLILLMVVVFYNDLVRLLRGG